MSPWSKTMNERQKAGLCRQCGETRDTANKLYCGICHEKLLRQLAQRRLLRKLADICIVAGCGKGVCQRSRMYCRKHLTYYNTLSCLWHKSDRRKKRAAKGKAVTT